MIGSIFSAGCPFSVRNSTSSALSVVIGLVGDHVGEVVDAVQLLRGLVQARRNVVLQLLGHPDDALKAALSAA